MMTRSHDETRTSHGHVALLMTAKTVWIIDFIKALASQLIVWHHFVSYGPLIKTLRPYASGVVDWLFVDARMAVQAFLVV